MRFFSLLLLALALPASALAQPSPWEKSFVPEALATYLPAGKTDLVVVAAGEKSAELITATNALRTGLRNSKATGLVMDSASIGSVADLDDEQIVKKCSRLPITRVILLRVFPAGPDEPARAVVTIYDHAAAVQGAFSAAAGMPLAAGTAAEASTTGVRPAAADEVTRELATIKTDTKKARAEYDRLFIDFDLWMAVSGSGAVSTWAEPHQGKYRKPLPGAEFYRAVGREDLAKSYENRRNTKILVTVLGTAVCLGGLIYALQGAGTVDYSAYNADQLQAANDGKLTTGLVLMTIGGLVAPLPWLFSSHPVDAPEARRLADEYNQRLKARLGLAQEESGSVSRQRAASVEVMAIPFARRNGGGLALVGTF